MADSSSQGGLPMFSERDRKIINRDCFNIIMMGDSVAEVESENGDHWIIMEVQEHLQLNDPPNLEGRI